VYEYIERVLRDTEIIPREYIVSYPKLPLRLENILSRTAAYYKYKNVVQVPAKDTVPDVIGMLVLNDSAVHEWRELLTQYGKRVQDEGMVVVVGNHLSAGHNQMWKLMSNDPAVTMTIDLWGFGILLYRKEFKEKQHFVLRYW